MLCFEVEPAKLLITEVEKLEQINNQDPVLVRISYFPMRIFYCCLWCFFKITTSLLFPKTIFIKGSLKNRSRDFAIYYARHRAHWDILLVAMSILTTKIAFIARSGLMVLWPFEHIKFLRQLVEPNFIIFINRGNVSKKETSLIFSVIQKKKHRGLMIFPEGTTIPERRKLNPGFIILAKRYRLPLIPINIIPGKYYGKDRHSSWWRYLTFQAWATKVRVGELLSLKKGILWEKAVEVNAKRTAKNEFYGKPSLKDFARAAMEIVDTV